MRRLPKNLSLLAVSVLAVGVVTVSPVYARNGSDDATSSSTTSSTTVKTEDNSTSRSANSGSNSTSTTTSSTSGSSKVRSAEVEVKHTETENEVETETHSANDLKEQAQKLLSDKRQSVKPRSIEVRQKACEAHKTELTKRSENYSRNAKRHLDTFNSIYTKVLAFQADKQLAAANFDTLKATADAKKAIAEAAVADLSGSDVSIDCTATDPAANIAALKTTVANTRTALQEYRAAVKDIIVALQSAKSAASTSTTPSSANTEDN